MKSVASLSLLFSLLFLIFSSPASAAVSTASKTSDVTLQSQAKLDTIIKNQQEILTQLDEIKKELAIVKIRATSSR